MKLSLRCAGAVGLAMAVLAGCGGSAGGDGPVISSAGSAKQGAAPPSTPAVVETPGTQPSTTLAQSQTVTVIEPKVSEGGQGRDVDPFKDIESRSRPSAAVIALPRLPAATEDTIQKSVVVGAWIPLKVGVPRPVQETVDKESTAARLAWQEREGGIKLAALRFVSPGAKGLRLGVLVKSLPIGARLRFYGDQAEKLFEIPALEVLNAIQRNVGAGDLSAAGSTYWSPNLGGEAITLEIEIPAGTDPKNVVMSVPVLSHATVDVRKEDIMLKIGESGSCNLDVPCSSNYNQLSQSVALMDFISDGSGGTVAGATYVCTGTLLNDRMSTGTPWFLSAKHCISTQTVASTLYTLWFYRSSSCNAGTVSSSASVLTTGATLLYTSPDVAAGQPMVGDTSFMRLNSAPPAGALFAGSSAMPLPNYTSVYGVHHPKGDVQKYSEGSTWGTVNCVANSTGFSCGGVASPSAFVRVSWTKGTTEGGSSGSGLFTRMNNKDYLVGQLAGGNASCSNRAGYDYYGRFDSVFGAVAPWLAAASATTRLPVFRLYNTAARTHFYTSDPVERDYLVTNSTAFNFEGVAYYAYGAQASATSAVHRFSNTSTNTHFYTIDAQERQHVQADLSPPFRYDGVAWFAPTAPTNGAMPMYRFYNRATKTHFYTMSAVERDYLMQHSTDFQLDGVAYYAWTSQ